MVLAPGFSCRGGSEGAASTGPALPSPEWQDASTGPSRPVVLDLTHALDACAFGHRGVLLDFGEAGTAAELRPGSLHPSPDDCIEHEGATWLRVRSHVVAASFYWPAAATEAQDKSAFVEARIRGVLARSATFAVDGRPMGATSLARGETRIVSARPATPLALSAGGHELVVHFVGGPRGSDDALAEIDWAHVGVGDSTEPYAAPTHADAVVDAVVGGSSIHSLSLRAPGFARCSAWIPADTTLEASLATAGGESPQLSSLSNAPPREHASCSARRASSERRRRSRSARLWREESSSWCSGAPRPMLLRRGADRTKCRSLSALPREGLRSLPIVHRAHSPAQ